MGSYITRKSHIGVPDRGPSAYPGPASDEDMEIAKRAAKLPKLSKAPKKIKSTKKKAISNKRKIVKSPEKKKTKITLFKEPKTKISEKINLDNSGTQLSAKAEKLGITEQELQRRINALKNWNLEKS